MRVAAVDLLISRREAIPSPGLVSALESFLSADHNSDLFNRGLDLLEDYRPMRTATMDTLLVDSVKRTFRNDANQIPSFGPYPNRQLRLLIKSNSLPDGIWKALIDEAASAKDPGPALHAISLLAQKHQVPDEVSEIFFRKLVKQKLLPEGLAEDSSLYFYGLDSEKPLRWDLYDCHSKACVARLLAASESLASRYKPYNGEAARIMVNLLARAVEESPALLDDVEFSRRLDRVLNEARSMKAATGDAVQISARVASLKAQRPPPLEIPVMQIPKVAAVPIETIAEPPPLNSLRAKCADWFARFR
ncbi:MAG: hypothetical protein J0L82_14365 [Deltaproteobacteria bacterium]|nr:hypothetical protein [Deltaproteobacteria bacterium]